MNAAIVELFVQGCEREHIPPTRWTARNTLQSVVDLAAATPQCLARLMLPLHPGGPIDRVGRSAAEIGRPVRGLWPRGHRLSVLVDAWRCRVDQQAAYPLPAVGSTQTIHRWTVWRRGLVDVRLPDGSGHRARTG